MQLGAFPVPEQQEGGEANLTPENTLQANFGEAL
jgi:hypothetical protein